jgi:pSer/pThr/pTyr-binding forkhead associated (FHA) protein
MRLVTADSGRPREGPQRAHLWLLDPAGQQVERAAEISGEEPVIIGRRADSTVVLPSHTVSRRHAQIWREGEDYYVSDLGSTNGTLLNGEPAIGVERLNDRDEIAVGIYKLIFRNT